MNAPRISWLGVLTLVPAIASCTSTADRVFEPWSAARHAISGHVTLRGYLMDRNATFVGTRVVGDADGVLVELWYGDAMVARTWTVDGNYRFEGLRPGSYAARSPVIGTLGFVVQPLIVADADVSADTLRIESIGDIAPVPNPFTDTLKIFFQVNDTSLVELGLQNISGRRIQPILAAELLPMVHFVTWIPRGLVLASLNDSIYWLTYSAEDDFRGQLLFREPAPPLATRPDLAASTPESNARSRYRQPR